MRTAVPILVYSAISALGCGTTTRPIATVERVHALPPTATLDDLDFLSAPPAEGCSSGKRGGLFAPNVAACGGAWTGKISDGNAKKLCAQGWHVCSHADKFALQKVSYADGSILHGCFAYDAAQNTNVCQPCTGGPGANEMAGMGDGCA